VRQFVRLSDPLPFFFGKGTEMTAPKKTVDSETATLALPDDPRQICGMILRALDPALCLPASELPQNFAAMVAALCDGEDSDDKLSRSIGALRAFSVTAEDAAKAQQEAIQRAFHLAQHGCGPRVDIPLGGPTVGEVKAVQRVLAALGLDASEEAALAALAKGESDAA
jgi:hypothetical protein